MPVNCNKTKSVLSCLALTTSSVVTILFWGLYFYNKLLLGPNEIIDKFPLWFVHSAHTFVSATALLDVLIARPKSVPFAKGLLSVAAFYLGYAVYTEYLIFKKEIYAYPLLKVFSTVGRYQFYGIVLLGVFLVFMMSTLVIKLVSVEAKRKPKKDKDKNRNKKPQQQNQQHQQAQKHSPAQNANVKKKKQNKQD
ncbi:hypothetical protein Aperf_G00000126600 [Anoplocephala perfoliata]